MIVLLLLMLTITCSLSFILTFTIISYIHFFPHPQSLLLHLCTQHACSFSISVTPHIYVAFHSVTGSFPIYFPFILFEKLIYFLLLCIQDSCFFPKVPLLLFFFSSMPISPQYLLLNTIKMSSIQNSSFLYPSVILSVIHHTQSNTSCF